MAVAVKNTKEASPSGSPAHLPVASLLGVLYVLASLVVVFWAIPSLWQSSVTPWLTPAAGAFVDVALLGLVVLAAAVALTVFGARLLGPQSPAGLKAGIFVGLLVLLVVGLLAKWAGLWIEHWAHYHHLFGDAGRTVGAILTGLVALVLVLVVARFAFKPGVERFLVAVEEQGWFSTTSYKKSQGQRVRRGTILGILVLVGCGIATLIHSKRLEAGPSDWAFNIPFTGKVMIENANDAATVLTDRQLPDAAEATLDRFTFREINEALLTNYVKIAEPGLDYDQGQLVSKKDYDEAVNPRLQRISLLQDAARKLENEGRTFEARDRASEAERIRLSLPTLGEPVPATGKTSYTALTLLPAVRFTLPLLLTAAAIWLAWRIVNVPAFADFLIATEAEMNKVSWTTRRRLVQDTIVVLVAVILMTIFLLVADIVWSNLLRGIGVLRFGEGSGETAAPTQKQRPW